MSDWEGSDRRRHQRINVEHPGLVQPVDQDEPVLAVTSIDLSEGGVRFFTLEPMEEMYRFRYSHLDKETRIAEVLQVLNLDEGYCVRARFVGEAN